MARICVVGIPHPSLDRLVTANKKEHVAATKIETAAPYDKLDEQEKVLLEGMDELIEVHGGDLRAVIETLLMAYDALTEQISNGFVRLRRHGE